MSLKISDPKAFPRLREFLDRLGMVHVTDLELPEDEVTSQRRMVEKQHPEETHEEHFARAVARVAYKVYGPKKIAQVVQEPPQDQPPPTVIVRFPMSLTEMRNWLTIFVLLLWLLLLFSIHAHAQVQFQASGGTVTAFCPFKVPCVVREGTNVSFSKIGSVVTINSSSTASTAFSAITPGTNINAGTFSPSGNAWDFSATTGFKIRAAAGATTAANGDIAYDTTAHILHIWQTADRMLIAATNVGSAGQPCMSNADGSCTFADPVVSGPNAAGTAPTANPVQVSGYDGTNVQRIKTDTSGNVDVIFPSAQHVVVDTAPTTAVTAASLPLPTGAATAAKQPALGTAGSASADVISVQGVASMTPVKTDGSGVTQPVSAASLPLPTGASTAAKQPALGTAGTPSADVISVQGVTSMTPLKVDGSGATQPVSGTTTANQGTAGSTNWLFKVMDAAGNARGANVNASNQLSVSCDNGCSGGAKTPADTYSNPTDALDSWSLVGLWNGTTWDRWPGDKTNGGKVNVTNSSITVAQATGSNLHVVCDSGCSGTGASVADEGTFTQGTTNFAPVGGFFNSSPVNLTSGQGGAAQMTNTRHLMVNVADAIPAGTNVIGHVIADSGSTTAVTGNVATTAADGSNVVLGAKADAKSTATDTTAITMMQVLKEISAMEQAPASRAVTNAGTFATQATLQTQTDTTMVGGVNIKEIGAVAAPVDTTGRLFVKPYPDTTTTSYHASAKIAASSTTDNAVLPGNATNTVLVTRVTVTCTETTAGIVNVELIKRSAADTGGTSAGMTEVPDDSNYSAASSAALTYTGTGPSVGAAVGDLDNAQVGCNASATAGPNDIYIFRPAKPIVLRGTAQQIAINLGGAVTGGNITVTFDWMETTTP